MFLDNLFDQRGDTFRNWSSSEVDDKFQLDLEIKNKLKSMMYKEIDVFEKSEIESIELRKIDLENLVGACRNDSVENWLQALYKLHKKRNFDLFHSLEHHKNFVNRVDSQDIPEVVEHDGKYYINSNGRHRLTIAKCLGIQTAYARVLKVKSSSA